MNERTRGTAADRHENPFSDASVRPAHHPEPGLYAHYKGARYRVIDTVRHSESEEELVLYRALYGEHGLWVRPLTMFVEKVSHGDARVPRFERVGD